MVVFHPRSLLERANRDPEFTRAARRCNVKIKVVVGEHAYIFSVGDGLIEEVNDDPTVYDAWDLEIGGSYESWLEVVVPEPRPFYQDVFSATLKHDFYVGGDMEMFFAYHPAIRRMVELMRMDYLSADTAGGC